MGRLTVYKCEGIRIRNQEYNKMAQCISSWVPIPVKSFTLMKDMSPQFDGVVVAWAWKVHVW